MIFEAKPNSCELYHSVDLANLFLSGYHVHVLRSSQYLLGLLVDQVDRVPSLLQVLMVEAWCCFLPARVPEGVVFMQSAAGLVVCSGSWTLLLLNKARSSSGTGVTGLGPCCLCMLEADQEVIHKLFLVGPYHKELFIGYANFYWAQTLVFTVVPPFAASVLCRFCCGPLYGCNVCCICPCIAQLEFCLVAFQFSDSCLLCNSVKNS